MQSAESESGDGKDESTGVETFEKQWKHNSNFACKIIHESRADKDVRNVRLLSSV